MTLPTELSVPSENLAEYTLFIAGDKKVGKTSLASEFPKHFIMEFEPGNAKHLLCRYKDIHSWAECVNTLIELKENPDYCSTLVIDDVPSMYEYCYQYVRTKMKLGETEKDNYDVWRTIKNEMTKVFHLILSLPVGKIFTSHTEVKEHETRKGATFSKLTHNLSGQCGKIVMGPMTLNSIMTFGEKGQRILILEGDDAVDAGHGFSNNFTWKGQRLKEIPLGRSPQQGYENFMKAFNNKLEVKE